MSGEPTIARNINPSPARFSPFLPDTQPDIPGRQLSITLEPAQQKSGEFYGVIPLPNERLGILIADVADKGTGARSRRSPEQGCRQGRLWAGHGSKRQSSSKHDNIALIRLVREA